MAKKNTQAAAGADAPAAALDGPMTALAELVAEGKSQAEAAGAIIEGLLENAKSPEDQKQAFVELIVAAINSQTVSGIAGKACEPHYRCVATTPHGHFFSIGRKFTADPKDEKNKVYIKDLKPGQEDQLKKELPKFLAVIGPIRFE